MISANMVKRLNRQINRETYSGYLYIGMGSFLETEGLKGMASWYKVQAQEEVAHATIMYNYVNQQGARVLLETIEEPPQEYKSALDTFEKTLEHEKGVTAMINDLMKLAIEENDQATQEMLRWFVTEQVEEEANPTEIIQRLKLVGKDGNGLLMIDNELGQRVFTPPSPLAAG